MGYMRANPIDPFGIGFSGDLLPEMSRFEHLDKTALTPFEDVI